MNQRQHWRRYAQRLKKMEDRYAPAVTRALMVQVKAFTKALRGGVIPAGQLLNPVMAKLMVMMQTTAAISEGRQQLGSLRQQEVKRLGPRNVEWIAWVIEQLKDHNTKFVVGITETTRDLLNEYLQDGLREGLTLGEIAAKIDREVPARYINRGFAIARTELNRGANLGIQLAARSYEYETEKTWITAGDHRVRGNMPEEKFNHVKLNGQKIDTFDTLGQPLAFNNGEPITQPGDPNASPGNTINCRCTIALTGKRDANGRLIRRSPSRLTSSIL